MAKIEFKRWRDVKEGDWVLQGSVILRVKEIDPTSWSGSRYYVCSDGYAHEHNINGWAAVTDELPSNYETPKWEE